MSETFFPTPADGWINARFVSEIKRGRNDRLMAQNGKTGQWQELMIADIEECIRPTTYLAAPAGQTARVFICNDDKEEPTLDDIFEYESTVIVWRIHHDQPEWPMAILLDGTTTEDPGPLVVFEEHGRFEEIQGQSFNNLESVRAEALRRAVHRYRVKQTRKVA